jgi:hypothetical protein
MELSPKTPDLLPQGSPFELCPWRRALQAQMLRYPLGNGCQLPSGCGAGSYPYVWNVLSYPEPWRVREIVQYFILEPWPSPLKSASSRARDFREKRPKRAGADASDSSRAVKSLSPMALGLHDIQYHRRGVWLRDSIVCARHNRRRAGIGVVSLLATRSRPLKAIRGPRSHNRSRVTNRRNQLS